MELSWIHHIIVQLLVCWCNKVIDKLYFHILWLNQILRNAAEQNLWCFAADLVLSSLFLGEDWIHYLLLLLNLLCNILISTDFFLKLQSVLSADIHRVFSCNDQAVCFTAHHYRWTNQKMYHSYWHSWVITCVLFNRSDLLNGMMLSVYPKEL